MTESTTDPASYPANDAASDPASDPASDRPDRHDRRDRRDRTKATIIGLLLLRVAALAFLILSHQENVDGGIAGDVRRYVEMATAEGTPYKDFQVEYPPVTFALIKGLYAVAGSSLGLTIAAVAVSQFLCDIGIAFFLRWAWGRRAQLAYLALGAPLVLWPFIYVRIDLFSALLGIAGLALVRRGRDVAGGANLAVAVLAKAWPIAVAPVLLVERRVRGVIAVIVTGVALAGAWLMVAGTSGIQQVFSFRDATGWQVESLPGILWHLRDPSRIKFESGAFRSGVMPLWSRPVLTLVSLGFLALAWAWAARRRNAGADDSVVYAWAPLASVLALLLFAPILSPQYVVWMLPFAALVVARGDRLVGGLTIGVTVLTTASYMVVPDAADGRLYGTLPVLARDLLLVVLLVVAMQTLAGFRTTGQRPDDEPPPAYDRPLPVRPGFLTTLSTRTKPAAPTGPAEATEPAPRTGPEPTGDEAIRSSSTS